MLAIILAIALLLPGRYHLLPLYLVVPLGVAAVVLALLAFAAANRGLPKQAKVLTAILVLIITAVVFVLLTKLVALLLGGGNEIRGWPLLSSGVYVWVSNILAFGLWYWLVDRGGPHARLNHAEERPDFFFPEMAATDAADPHWSPNLVEYMYLSFTNATAFSPTDTLPLTSRVRALMTVEAAMSLATIALVAARAVNILT